MLLHVHLGQRVSFAQLVVGTAKAILVQLKDWRRTHRFLILRAGLLKLPVLVNIVNEGLDGLVILGVCLNGWNGLRLKRRHDYVNSDRACVLVFRHIGGHVLVEHRRRLRDAAATLGVFRRRNLVVHLLRIRRHVLHVIRPPISSEGRHGEEHH